MIYKSISKPSYNGFYFSISSGYFFHYCELKQLHIIYTFNLRSALTETPGVNQTLQAINQEYVQQILI